jgi:hypothetical protein
MYGVFSPCGASELGADGAVVIQLLNVLINTEIKCGHLCVVCRGETPGRSGFSLQPVVLAVCIAMRLFV